MEIAPLEIHGAWVAQAPVWSDSRGYFREWFRLDAIKALTGRSFTVEQANVSESSRGTVRGIHYSVAESGQAKWVTCIAGSIKDFVVDIRPSSETFGKWIEIELTSDSGKAVFIGEGLGHAFISMKNKTIVSYLISTPYSPSEEFEINPLDPEIGIQWGIELSELKVSEKDKSAPTLKERNIQGKLPKLSR